MAQGQGKNIDHWKGLLTAWSLCLLCEKVEWSQSLSTNGHCPRNKFRHTETLALCCVVRVSVLSMRVRACLHFVPAFLFTLSWCVCVPSQSRLNFLCLPALNSFVLVARCTRLIVLIKNLFLIVPFLAFVQPKEETKKKKSAPNEVQTRPTNSQSQVETSEKKKKTFPMTINLFS